MSLAGNLVIDLYSVMILTFICVQTLKDTEKSFLQQQLFLALSFVTALMLFGDILSRFNGNPHSIYPVLNHIGNFSVFFLNLFISSLWLLYTHYRIFHDEKKIKHLLYILCTFNGINIALLILTQWWGLLYSIDANNIYHRGPFYFYPISMTTAFAVASFVLIFVNRKKVERNRFFSFLLLPIPPLVCMALQIIFNGLSLMLNGVAFSLLILFVSMQNRSLNTDYLTGAYNRKKLETYMKDKISASTKNRSFSAILIDLDDFKSINDNFGHDIGDDALTSAVRLLKSCLGPFDFIARLGGDEFCIILDTSNSTELDAAARKIHNRVEHYNRQHKKPYALAFSMGQAVYDYRSHMRAEEFLKHIDSLMYETKRARKELI